MSKTITILLAEDEAVLAQIVKESLETRGFKVIHCADGEAVMPAYQEHHPDLLVLDVMMPKKDGFTVAKEIRNINAQLPIIFLTAKSQTKDVVEGFTVGGNDYLKKPFSMEELIVRMQNLLRSTTVKESDSELITVGNYTFDVAKQQLQFQQEERVELTHKESQLLFYLLQCKNEILERSFILNTLWDTDDFFTARSMDVYITKLRKKLSKDETIKIINVRGIGYKLLV